MHYRYKYSITTILTPAVYSNQQSNVTLSDSTLSNCSAGSGGGIFVSGGSLVHVSDTNFDACTAAARDSKSGGTGGTIFVA